MHYQVCFIVIDVCILRWLHKDFRITKILIIIMNSNGLELSPCCALSISRKGISSVLPFTLMNMFVSSKRNLTSLISSYFGIYWSIWIRSFRLMVWISWKHLFWYYEYWYLLEVFVLYCVPYVYPHNICCAMALIHFHWPKTISLSSLLVCA